MAKQKKRASWEEKERIILAYRDSNDTQDVFCRKHEINRRTLSRWITLFEDMGYDYFSKDDHKPVKIDRSVPSDYQQLKDEVLKLRIENERLKKNYVVETNADGKTQFIRLKRKNSK